MRIEPTALEGVFFIRLEPFADERGYFARTLCARELTEAGLVARYAQHSTSFNIAVGTLRGMHWQADPHGETKIVRCTRGRIFDVAVDIRPESSSFCRWVGAELSVTNGMALYVPGGFAHGFLTLEAESEVLYAINEPYRPEFARGFRYDDSAVGIDWPTAPAVISDRDQDLPFLEDI